VIFWRYEIALVQQDLIGLPVIPLFFGDQPIDNQHQSKWGIFQWFKMRLEAKRKPLEDYKAFKISGAEWMFPDVPHKRSDGATEFLTFLLNGRPFPTYLRSIRATMERVLKMRGWKSRHGLDEAELNDLTDILIKTLPKQ